MSDSLNEDDLFIKHKKERKDLQAQIQILKKTCPKGDKKKKKEVTEMIARLEQELDEKQANEIEQIKTIVTITVPEPVSRDDLDDTRVTKAQKRRLKKAAEVQEQEERIKEQEKMNRKGPRLIESKQINEILRKLGLKLYSVPADGNCLYCSIAHQLESTGRSILDVDELRQLTAEYLREHKDELLPFMSHPDDSDEEFTEEHFARYCDKVENTTAWGGQIEITALSNILKCPIKIIQASTTPTIQGEEFDGPPLVLTYHRHLYRLGEHYNSAVVSNHD